MPEPMTAARDAAAPPLVVVGASARALAESARRAGWSVHAADLFADADLRAAATEAVRVPTAPELPWPDGLESCVRRFPVAPWIYSGALENHPELVDRMARARPLAGNAGDRLRAARDPARVARVARAAGLAFPKTLTDPAAVPADGSFLVKPRASAGGRGIAPWRGGPVPDRDVVWQRLVPGRSWSVAFLMHAGRAGLFGASRQLVGTGWCGATGFGWSGAIDVPLATLAPAARARLDRLGAALAEEFGLLGLVGIDLVEDPAGSLHVVEVNPRPTASMELVERTTGASVVATHLAACGFPHGTVTREPWPRHRAWAKAVVFADSPVVAGPDVEAALATLAARWHDGADGWPALADVPASGAAIAPGGPALTVFAAALTPRAALRTLRGRVADVRAALRQAAVSRRGDAAERPRRPPRGSTA